MKEKVLVFGSNGQLGQSLKHCINKTNNALFNFIFLSKLDVDITKLDALKAIIKKHIPKYVINCVAYTKVDLAEDQREDVHQINVIGPKNLATLCKKYDSCLIHISTDFVFKGDTIKYLNEEDKCNPINYYGLSKLQGEQEILRILKTYYIIRTSWLYSEFGNNFVKTMLRLGKEKESLKVVKDQIGTPTYAVDLAKFMIHILKEGNKKYGIYHYSNEGLCSWYDFSKSIFEYSDYPIKVYPINSSEFKTKALRPKFSVMNKEKVVRTFAVEVNYWRDSLKICLEQIKKRVNKEEL